ncbi:hypothetical protein BJX63DRAFT_434739 [Aspergillus granulosus]|uniref:Uncharacterized protein n=1 Tax=Aspergillus granulosus TaxID=176169 RepID=A0ABR4H403_9EURO
MHMGLHLDPKHLVQPSPFQAEIHHRLWATILELVIQTGMDAGVDNLPLNDVQGLTDTTIQVALLRSLPLRLQIARVVNNFRSGPSYKETLRLSTELSDLHQETAAIIPPRPLLYASQGQPILRPSRKFTLNNALHILSSAPIPPTEPTDYTSLYLSGTSSFHDVLMQAAAVLCDELLTQIAKDKTIKPPPTPTKQYNDILRPLDAFLTSNLARLHIRETNV